MSNTALHILSDMILSFIRWDVGPEFVDLGIISLRYYGMFFVLAFIFGYKIEGKMFKSEGVNPVWLDKLWMYTAIATLIGARLGHCFFYDWAYFSEHPMEMILPFRFSPHFHFVGYQGLASHGAAVGIILGLWYFSRKVTKRSILWVLDRAVVPIALAGMFIRLGNLMNSEIVGAPTEVSWGFQFVRNHEEFARHPAQLYEAICYLIAFVVLMYMYWRTDAKRHLGRLFGTFLILVFSARFMIEFVKEVQEEWEREMVLDMGQILSIPFILVGCWALWYSGKHLFEEKQKV